MNHGRDLYIRVAVLAACVAAAYLQPLRVVRFVGRSMAPTYDNGTLALASSMIGPIAVGDVVVIDSANGPIVKRVAKVAGDRYWEVNMFGRWTPAPTGARHPNRLRSRQQTIPPGYIFVLGDNSSASYDSRQFGLVAIKDVRARLISPRENALA